MHMPIAEYPAICKQGLTRDIIPSLPFKSPSPGMPV
jgi:hypothetical protein